MDTDIINLYGIQEMSLEEQEETNGGIVPVLAVAGLGLACAGAFVVGIAAGYCAVKAVDTVMDYIFD